MFGWLGFRYVVPPPPPKNIAFEAKAYWRTKTPAPISKTLQELIDREGSFKIESQEHPLLTKTAPDFDLKNHLDSNVRLSQLTANGPTIVVFYLGYGCDHCVAQLFGLHQDLRFFRELGVNIVAISNDSTEHTRERYKEYGEFGYPVLSDPQDKVAASFGCYLPPEGETPEKRLHGTFVLDSNRRVVWASVGKEPFTHNVTLLKELIAIRNDAMITAANTNQPTTGKVLIRQVPVPATTQTAHRQPH